MIDILDDTWCESELTQNGTLEFDYKPEVLCIGFNQSFNIRVYLKDDDGDYHHIEISNSKYEKLVRKEKSWYVVGKLCTMNFKNNFKKRKKNWDYATLFYLKG